MCYLAQYLDLKTQWKNWKSFKKNDFRNNLKEKYENYENGLIYLKMDTLLERRKNLFYSFGKKCLKLKQTKHLFPLKERNHQIQPRYTEKYEVLNANTDWLKTFLVFFLYTETNEWRRKKKRVLSLKFYVFGQIRLCFGYYCLIVTLHDLQ